MTTRSVSYPVSTKVESSPRTNAIMITRTATVSPMPRAVISVLTRRTHKLRRLYLSGIFMDYLQIQTTFLKACTTGR